MVCGFKTALSFVKDGVEDLRGVATDERVSNKRKDLCLDRGSACLTTQRRRKSQQNPWLMLKLGRFGCGLSFPSTK